MGPKIIWAACLAWVGSHGRLAPLLALPERSSGQGLGSLQFEMGGAHFKLQQARGYMQEPRSNCKESMQGAPYPGPKLKGLYELLE